MDAHRWVAIDVEPGGATKPEAYLGAVEVVDGALGAQVLLRIAAERRDSLSGGVVQASGWDLSNALRMLDAFIGEADVVVYNARYDCAALRRLHDAARLPLPSWRVLDALRVVRANEGDDPRYFYSLQSVVLRRALLTEEECDRRRELHRTGHTNKWLLHDAQDDAMAAALVILDCAHDRADDLAKVAADHDVSWSSLALR